MSKLLTTLRNAPKRTSALVAMIAAAVIVPAALFAWGPDRPTYTITQPADHVTFNSITNNPNIGDERNFVGIRENGTGGKWQDTVTAQPGKSYVVRMYVHNNAAANFNKVAENVTAKFNLPTSTGKSLQVNGFLNASNASPKEVYDHATFTSAQDFNLAYQKNTLKYYNNANGNGFAIPESVFTSTGALLGYDKMDGKIPGCFQYAGYLTFVVTPQFAPTPKANFTINKEVRKDGDKTFVESVAAKPGDKLNYRMTVANTGETALKNINLKDTLPKGVTNIPGTVRIMNANNPGGAYIKDGDNMFKNGTNIGAYTAGSNAIVIFDAKVSGNDSLPVCGPNKLRNIASAQPEGQNPKDDTADVTVPKECLPVPAYTCDSLSANKIDRTNFVFTGKATAKDGATIANYTFNFGDGTTTTVTNPANVKHTYAKDGTYTVKMSVTVKVDGQNKTITDAKCETKVTVEKPPVVVKPVYTCDSLTADKISRTEVSFNGKATATGGATIVSYTFDFGDGKATTVTNPTDVKHTYDKDGTYTAKLSVTVKVAGSEKTVTDTKCSVKVTIPSLPPSTIEVCDLTTKKIVTINEADFDSNKYSKDYNDCKETPPVENCTVPGKEHLPKNSPDCVETPITELPNTGAGSEIVAMIGAGSLIAAIGYYAASRRTL